MNMKHRVFIAESITEFQAFVEGCTERIVSIIEAGGNDGYKFIIVTESEGPLNCGKS